MGKEETGEHIVLAIMPNDKYYGYFELTDEEEAEIRERFSLLDAEQK